MRVFKVPAVPKSHATQKVLPNIIDPINSTIPSTVNAAVTRPLLYTIDTRYEVPEKLYATLVSLLSFAEIWLTFVERSPRKAMLD
jgi:hypothetical protein